MVTQDAVADGHDVSSVLPQKRVLPARERRESAAKRQASSPVATPKPASTPKKPTPVKQTPKTVPRKYKKRKSLPEATPTPRLSTPIIEEGLPAKVTDTRPLPTSHQPQPSRLSVKEYQNIAESAVLAASLHRSRLKWLAEGVFEKYWTKPSKKKGTDEIANNPDLKTMQRLGPSAILIGPHTFEATIYTVRESIGQRHPNQYPQRPVIAQPDFQTYLPSGAQTTNSQARPIVNQTAQIPQAALKQEKPPPGVAASPSTNGLKFTKPAQHQPPTPSTSQQKAATPGPDPVIRMLATRAATNPELKALMKVVASSKASQEQLKLFQSHIDELNILIRHQQESEKALLVPPINQAGHEVPKVTQLDGPGENQFQTLQPPHDGNSRTLPMPYPTNTQRSGLPQSQQRANVKMGPLGPPLKAPPYAHYPAQQQRMSIPEPQIKAIVLEFTTPASSTTPASQDRYLFPQYAVLDTPLSGQGLEMVCSFFVIRKGSDLMAMRSLEEPTAGTPVGGRTRWRAGEEYYQPVTMTVKTSQHRILETIARAAKPLGEVQGKMKEVMQTKTRVKDEWLVMKLPREKGLTTEDLVGHERGLVDGGVEMKECEVSGDEDDELKPFYGI
jgi:hypothetical protein